MITIHEKPDCIACRAAKMFFKSREVPFEVVPLTEETTAKFVAMSLQAAPVVECRTPSGKLTRCAGGSIHLWKQMVNAIRAEQEG